MEWINKDDSTEFVVCVELAVDTLEDLTADGDMNNFSTGSSEFEESLGANLLDWEFNLIRGEKVRDEAAMMMIQQVAN